MYDPWIRRWESSGFVWVSATCVNLFFFSFRSLWQNRFLRLRFGVETGHYQCRRPLGNVITKLYCQRWAALSPPLGSSGTAYASTKQALTTEMMAFCRLGNSWQYNPGPAWVRNWSTRFGLVIAQNLRRKKKKKELTYHLHKLLQPTPPLSFVGLSELCFGKQIWLYLGNLGPWITSNFLNFCLYMLSVWSPGVDVLRYVGCYVPVRYIFYMYSSIE